jgi:hypothetical protein
MLREANCQLHLLLGLMLPYVIRGTDAISLICNRENKPHHSKIFFLNGNPYSQDKTTFHESWNPKVISS